MGDTISYECMEGALYSEIGLVEKSVDCTVAGMDPTEKVKGCCITKMKVEREVDMA